MPYLPVRPDLDQLRHQAKDLLHAAQRGDTEAAARIRAVSDRVFLSSAQLAIAREYGFASWARLKLEVQRRDILNSRDLSRLARLLAEHPEMAAVQMENWTDHKCAGTVGYMAMLRFDSGRLGLARELPGTGAMAKALIQAGAPVDGEPGDTETPLITAASYGDAEVARVLVEAGADIDAVSAPDSGGVPSSTALQHAAVFGMTEVINVLVAAGARPAAWRRQPPRATSPAGRCPGSPWRAGSGRWCSPPTTSGWRSSTSSSPPGRRSTRPTPNGDGCRCMSRRATAGPPASGGCSPTAPTRTSATPGTTGHHWRNASLPAGPRTARATRRSRPSSGPSPGTKTPARSHLLPDMRHPTWARLCR